MTKRSAEEARVLAAESAAASPGAELDDDALDALLPSEGFVTLPTPSPQEELVSSKSELGRHTTSGPAQEAARASESGSVNSEGTSVKRTKEERKESPAR